MNCPVCGSGGYFDVFGPDCSNQSCSNFRGKHAYAPPVYKARQRVRGQKTDAYPPAPRDFVDAYIEAALWSTNDESTPSGGVPLDENYGPSDLTSDTREQMELDCAKFYAENHHFWEEIDGVQDGLTDESAGHDFWLTREGHGTGFWDREDDLSDDNQKALADAAHAYGSFNLWVTDDGEIEGG